MFLKISTFKKALKYALLFNIIFGAGVVSAATLSMSPTSGSFEIGCDRELTIEIDVTGQSANSADVFINYDQTQIDILDGQPSVADTQLINGDAFQAYAYEINETTGRIRSTGFNIVGDLTSKKTFAKIPFQAKPGATSATFDIQFDGVGVSLDSNIAESNGGGVNGDILTGATDGTYTFVTGPCEADTQRPGITFQSPVNGQKNVPLNTNVIIRITDNQSGINLSTVQFTVNGVSYTPSSSEVTYSGTPLDYTFTINPASDFPADQAITVVARADDQSGNSRQSQITFNVPDPPPAPTPTPTPTPVPDTTSPTVTFVDPQPFQQGVPSSANLRIRVVDTESDINQGSIRIFINNVEYRVSDGEVSVSAASPLDITLNIDPRNPLLTDNYNLVRIYGSDSAGNRFDREMIFNVPTEIQTIFDVEKCETISTPPSQNNTCSNQTINVIEIIEQSELDLDRLLPLLNFLPIFAGILYLLSLPRLFGRMIGIYLGFRTKNAIGTVADKISREPIPLARVNLVIKDSNYVKETTITDYEGKYKFNSIEPGQYRLEVNKVGYRAFEKDVVFENDFSSLQFDVAIQPFYVAFNHPETNLNVLRYYLTKLFNALVNIGFIIGFFGSLFSFYVFQDLLNLVVVLLYFLALFILWRRKPRYKKYSTVVDADTNYGVPFSVVKVFDVATNSLVTTEIADKSGRTNIKPLIPGDHYIMVKSHGYNFPSTRNTYPIYRTNYTPAVGISLNERLNVLSLFVDPTVRENNLVAKSPGVNNLQQRTQQTGMSPNLNPLV